MLWGSLNLILQAIATVDMPRLTSAATDTTVTNDQADDAQSSHSSMEVKVRNHAISSLECCCGLIVYPTYILGCSNTMGISSVLPQATLQTAVASASQGFPGLDLHVPESFVYTARCAIWNPITSVNFLALFRKL